MKGSIRFLFGFLVAFGAVGGLEDPNASLLLQSTLAMAGLAVMAWGVAAMKQQNG